MTYLANVIYRVTERIFGIPFKVYRQGEILIEANSDAEAIDKMKKEAKENPIIYTWQISKPL